MQNLSATAKAAGCYAALRYAFGDEFENLPSLDAINAVLQDFSDACDEDGICSAEYRNRIGRGNLESYSRCLLLKRR